MLFLYCFVSPRDLGVLVQTVQLGIIFMRAFNSWSPPRKTETTVDISDRGNMIHVIGYTDEGRIENGWGDNETIPKLSSRIYYNP